eukprot:TRINITY_DN5236_c0_g1_i1.p1 TRINITY_DN5236_c0_g1~~TRINITY_DN5236_c0_g1_i1.p1  ORF type:complete len:184 (-),score=42.47 TRINITY_DN5236_c0_g1_i1:520-1071(-)
MSELKLIIVGRGGVGKSALSIQLIRSHFVEDYDPTIENNFRHQVYFDEEPCVLNIFDTAGQEDYTMYLDQYIRTGQTFLLVYSIIDFPSFEAINTFQERILRIKDADTFPGVLVGNKKDLDFDRQVKESDGQAKADILGLPFFETSAKTRENVDEIFYQSVREYRKTIVTKEPKRRGRTCTLF